MPWTDDSILQVSRTIEGAVWWGAFAAIDQWTINHRFGRPHTPRPTDAELVAAARDGTLDGELISQFAIEYQVFRFPLNQHDRREERLTAVSRALHETYHVENIVGPADLAGMWWDAIGAVRAAMARYGRTANLRSFCMKSLWLHQPVHATMWDSFAVRALNGIQGSRHKANINSEIKAADFLADFEQLFEAKRALVDWATEGAREITGHHYTYPRRVLDKALWLLGVENNIDAVDAVRVVLHTDTERRIASEQRFPDLVDAMAHAA